MNVDIFFFNVMTFIVRESTETLRDKKKSYAFDSLLLANETKHKTRYYSPTFLV